ncbi:MAG: 50S ribosomal protein L25 [Rhodothermales bacterium]|nr:50S ribosomal protein L25 [Rhodothermales bacterium]
MNTLKIAAQPRESGKKATRAVRRAGFVPCIVYGVGEESVALQLAAADLRQLVFSDQRYRVELQVGKDSYDCVLKDVDFNPTTDQPVHADFQMLRAGVAIQLSIPVQYVGKAKGQIEEGGEIEFLVHELEIETLPQNMPDHLTVDISNLDVGDTLHVGDVSFEGITVVTPEAQSLVTCFRRRVVEEEVAEVEVPEGELAEVAEGEEGAEAPEGQEESSE